MALHLLANQRDAEGWTVTNPATKWAMDQLIDNALTVHTGPKVLTFIRQANGDYTPPPGVGMALTRDESGYQLQDPTGTVMFFDQAGRIRYWMDRNENTMTFTYDGSGKLQTVTDAFGNSLTFGYSGDRLTSVTDFAGRSVSYTYTNDNPSAGSGQALTAFRDAEGNTWGYAYDAANRLTALYHPEHPAQAVVTNDYDDLSRVITQTDALGNVSTFAYSDFRNMEENPDDSQVVHRFDAHSRYTGREDPLGHRAQMDYDGQWRMRGMTDRLDQGY